MDGQPPLIPDPASTSTLFLGGHLPPTDRYETFIHLFPGNNAHAPWGTRGLFQFDVTVYVAGRETGRVRSPVCDEKGNLRLEINPAAGDAPAGGMFLVEYRHAREIPVETYAFHVHKETGTYVSCNITPFIGDKLYPEVHSSQMENNLFWPGIVADEDNDPVAVVVNPYEAAMAFQVHLLAPGGRTVGSETLRLRGRASGEYPLLGLFEDHARDIRRRNGAYSYCVSSQYKLVTYFMLRNRTHRAISMMDHLHNFCLA